MQNKKRYEEREKVPKVDLRGRWPASSPPGSRAGQKYPMHSITSDRWSPEQVTASDDWKGTGLPRARH